MYRVISLGVAYIRFCLCILLFVQEALSQQGSPTNAFGNPPGSAPFFLDQPQTRIRSQITQNDPNRLLSIRDVPCGVPRTGSDDPFRLIDANYNPRGTSDIPFLGRTVFRLVNGSAVEVKIKDDMRIRSGQSCWQAEVVRDGKIVCGGSLVGSHTVLTTSSCVIDLGNRTGGMRLFEARRFQVTLGSVQLNDDDGSSAGLSASCIQRFQVMLITSHGMFNPETNENDIAVLKLDRDVDFTRPCICPLCLSSDLPDFTEVCAVTGFGLNREVNPDTDNSLKMSHISILFLRQTNPRCGIRTGSHNSTAPDVNNLLCGEILPDEQPCQGDTGGALICFDAETRSHYQAGIISYGFGCKTGSIPVGVVTRIQPYLQWIHEFSQGDAGVQPPTPDVRRIKFKIWRQDNSTQ